MLSKKELRPEINYEPSINELESFQNEVLRPILKLQNDNIQLMFQSYLKNKKQNFEVKETSEKMQFIWNSLKKDVGLKNQLLGTIIGLLESKELTFYFAHEQELSKRINSMLIKRIESKHS
jgi:hypothetical protein